MRKIVIAGTKHMGTLLPLAFTDTKGSPVNMGLHQLYFTAGVAYKFK